MKKGTLADFLIELSKKSIDTESFRDESLIDSLQLKIEYFTGIKATLNPLYSQALANQLIVMHNVLLEGSTTQEWIEKSTLLPRSTISEVLTQLVKRGVIKVAKKDRSKTKLYHSTVSFSELMLASIDRVIEYESTVRKHLSDFIAMTRKIHPVSKETKRFLEFLRNLKKAYTFAQKFSKNMKVEFVVRLKNEFDRGFVFF